MTVMYVCVVLILVLESQMGEFHFICWKLSDKKLIYNFTVDECLLSSSDIF